MTSRARVPPSAKSSSTHSARGHEPAPAPAISPHAEEAPGGRHSLETAASRGHRFESIPTHASRGQERTLPDALLEKMERSFGQDFSQVRIHQNDLPASLGADGLTQGNHIHLAPGAYEPASRAGQAMIAHELAHVVQQRKGRVRATAQASGAPLNLDGALEREADDAGRRASGGQEVTLAGGPPLAAPSAPSGPVPIQRGLFNMLGSGNPRLYLPTWLGGYSEAQMQEPQNRPYAPAPRGGTTAPASRSGGGSGNASKQRQPTMKQLLRQAAKDSQKEARTRRQQEEKEKRESRGAESSTQDTVADETPPTQTTSSYDSELPGEMSKTARRRERKRAEKEEQRLREEQERAAALQRKLTATRRWPRHVERHDRDFTSQTNRSGQGKSHRRGNDLHPAGNHPITATQHLIQDSPYKGSSDRTSFVGPNADRAQDYSAGGTRQNVQFKYRKHRRALLKGKADAQGFSSYRVDEVLDQIDRSPDTKQERASARAFANKDKEYQVKGVVPARFLKWHDDSDTSDTDSDSDDATTDDDA